ncbi:uncharacterized protein LOC110067331 isoform X2 [Orbicella faveolata]|nr:uncharacterized protein LOC110067331 isoform X2 [Orbicella faveolata]XP_020630323.1 uncharacterized protein LOC110067331 isoform X2 [Orbicella faveolata]XP_020630330.1 uncharacterized protein LOC110067331 isoform X2 [Orbicella faveolata]
MLINELAHETIEELCSALEKVPTLNWKVLMKSRSFCSLYTREDDVALIGNSMNLINDMIHREIKLQHLLNGLMEIGNRKAVSIILKGGEKCGLIVQDSGGLVPPTFSIDQNRKFDNEKKYSNFSCQQRREQGETLGFPIQEECSEKTGHPTDTRFESSLNEVKYVISTIFPCFYVLE